MLCTSIGVENGLRPECGRPRSAQAWILLTVHARGGTGRRGPTASQSLPAPPCPALPRPCHSPPSRSPLPLPRTRIGTSARKLPLGRRLRASPAKISTTRASSIKPLALLADLVSSLCIPLPNGPRHPAGGLGSGRGALQPVLHSVLATLGDPLGVLGPGTQSCYPANSEGRGGSGR